MLDLKSMFCKKNRNIVLLTDFGYKDNYVGEIKGIISTITKAKIIDLSHYVTPFSVLNAQYFLYSSYSYFPKRSIFCVAVDPSPSQGKQLLIAKYKHYYFVLPDNGIISIFNNKDLIVYKIKDEYLQKNTNFNGRDNLAPISAKISNNLNNITKFAIKTNNYIKNTCQFSLNDKNDNIKILHVDRFGNIVTAIKNKYYTLLSNKIKLKVANKKYTCRNVVNIDNLNNDEIGIIQGSSGFIEIIQREQSAAKTLKLEVDSVIKFLK